MTSPQHPRTRRHLIPFLGDDDQPTAEIIDAYWQAADLAAHGWRIQRLTYDVDVATATVVARSPSRRVVAVSWDLRGDRVWRQQVPGPAAKYLLRFAAATAHIGALDAETGDENLVQLCWLLQVRQRPEVRRSWRRTDALPIVAASEQPSAAGRAAAWLIARLTIKYRWRIFDLGGEVAGGGFLAHIPADALSIFPSTMDDDGTAAAALARLVPALSGRDLAVLRRLDYESLWVTDQPAGAGQ